MGVSMKILGCGLKSKNLGKVELLSVSGLGEGLIFWGVYKFFLLGPKTW